MKHYYEAYEDRYKQVHAQTNKAWSGERHSPTIETLLNKYGACTNSTILEVGCGEGQNAIYLLKEGYNVEASDISPEAIRWCKQNAKKCGVDASKFFVMDVLSNNLNKKYDFIYSVAVIHMLVEQLDRDNFLKFFYEHLKENGKGIIITMGDGVQTYKTNPNDAFKLATRNFEGKNIEIATTSCRMVTKEEFVNEIERAGLKVLNLELDESIQGFNICMVAEVALK